VTWKSKIKAQYPNPNDYSAFMGDFSTSTGTVTFGMMILSGFIFKKFGWGVAAMITPTVLLITGGWLRSPPPPNPQARVNFSLPQLLTSSDQPSLNPPPPTPTHCAGVIFFGLVLFSTELTPMLAGLGMTPLYAAVLIGAAQNIFSKWVQALRDARRPALPRVSCWTSLMPHPARHQPATYLALPRRASKYSLFDPCKEMAYIPLEDEVKTKGKVRCPLSCAETAPCSVLLLCQLPTVAYPLLLHRSCMLARFGSLTIPHSTPQNLQAAIDVICNPLGKSGGALIQQFMIIGLGSLAASTPYLGMVLLAMVLVWLKAAGSLNVQFQDLQQERRERPLE
jgi:AAA family ATP:ADP antiporter